MTLEDIEGEIFRPGSPIFIVCLQTWSYDKVMARTKLRVSLNAGGAMGPVIGPNPSYCIWNFLFSNSPCVRNTIESEHYYSLMGGAEPIHANGMYSCFDSYMNVYMYY